MNVKTNTMVKMGLFLALGLILPYIFHVTGIAGPVFLPMHIPILLCAFILGEKYGLILGIITPFLNSMLTGMPPIYPTAICMALELGTYGFVAGYLYKKKDVNLILALIISMVLGRVISGIANYALLTVGGSAFVLKMFLMATFVKALPGIIIQVILIPIMVKLLESVKGLSTVNG